MSKTPEEMAEEYCLEIYGYKAKHRQKDFLAGYQAATPQWISVKERLPEINKGFVGFVESNEVCNCYRYPDHSRDNSPVFYAQTKTGLLICGLESVTHWMPLPEAPKEDK